MDLGRYGLLSNSKVVNVGLLGVPTGTVTSRKVREEEGGWSSRP